MDGLYGTQMVHRWYADGEKKIKKNFVPYRDGIKGLYGTQMVHRWYADGTNRSYGTHMVLV